MEEGKWYGVWVENEGDFKLAQETLMATYGIVRKLPHPLSYYKGLGEYNGAWVICMKGRVSLGYSPDREWNEHRNGPLVEVPLIMSLENE